MAANVRYVGTTPTQPPPKHGAFACSACRLCVCPSADHPGSACPSLSLCLSACPFKKPARQPVRPPVCLAARPPARLPVGPHVRPAVRVALGIVILDERRAVLVIFLRFMDLLALLCGPLYITWHTTHTKKLHHTHTLHPHTTHNTRNTIWYELCTMYHVLCTTATTTLRHQRHPTPCTGTARGNPPSYLETGNTADVITDSHSMHADPHKTV